MPELLDTETEQRTITADVRDMSAEGRTLRGYACLYGVESRPIESRKHGRFTETIQPGAFADVLAGDPDVVLTFNHDESRVLARTASGTLRLFDEERGLRFEADLGDGPTAQDVRDMVRRGDVRGASFRFQVADGGDQWDGERRTLTRVRSLLDLSLATTPAYDGPTVELRSLPAPATDDERADNDETKEGQVPDTLTVEDPAAAPNEETTETRVVTAMRAVNKGESRSLTVGGAEPILPPELSTLLFDKMRPFAIALASGIRVHPTSSDSVIFPKITSDVDPTWVAAGEEIPEGAPGLTKLEGKPKKLAHRVEIENEVLDDSAPSAQTILDQHLATMLALKLDRSIFEGDPATDTDSIRGLRHTVGIQELSMGTDGAALTNYDPFIRAVGMLRAANVPGPYAIATNPRTLTALELLKRETGSSEQLPAPVGLPPFYVSSQLAIDEVQGEADDAGSAYVYAPAQLLLINRLEGEILIDRSRLFHRDMSEIRAKLRADLLVPNPVAVVRIKGIIPAA